jgi:hypothetical protein
MYKISLTLLLIVFAILNSYAQKDTLSRADKATLDSMMKADQFFKLMNQPKKNSFEISVGVGNGSFSAHNQAVNATGVTNQVIFTPAIFYRFKSGFSLGVTGYITSDSGKTELYQTGATAAYDYVGAKVSAGGSFTRYFSDMDKYNSKSLYQNDFYAYVKKASGIIQPVLSLGFSNGKYKAIDPYKVTRTVRIFVPPPPRDTTITVTVQDTTHNKASYFYTAIGIEHDFNFYGVFSKGDELDFTPSFVVNAGSDNTSTTQVNKALTNKPRLARRLRQAPSGKFQLQSVAASFESTYSVGKFFLTPTLYLDYYLPSTTAKRFSAIYSVTAGFSF